MTTRRRAPKRPPRDTKRRAALALIAGGMSTTEVATELKVNRATVNRWRTDPEFDEELRELQEAQSDAVHALLTAEQLAVARAIVAMATGKDAKGEPVKADMAAIKAGQVFFELLGRHKNSPVAPPEKGGDAESEEDVLSLLATMPTSFLERALAVRKPKERDL